jgi:hypothetical protein
LTRDEDWPDREVSACFVEVPQVKTVLLHLPAILRCGVLMPLKLDYDHHARAKHDAVDPPPHAGDRELQEDCPPICGDLLIHDAADRAMEDRQLLVPDLNLLLILRAQILLSRTAIQRRKDTVSVAAEEVAKARAVVRRHGQVPSRWVD